MIRKPSSLEIISSSKLCPCWMLMELLMEIKDQVLMVWITTDNGQKMLFQNQIVQRSSLWNKWLNNCNKQKKYSCSATFMVTQNKKAYLFMDATTTTNLKMWWKKEYFPWFTTRTVNHSTLTAVNLMFNLRKNQQQGYQFGEN